MSVPARNQYLEQEILTAGPQKLQLLLIEGAIRNLQRVKSLWSDSQDEQAGEAIVRAQEIVAQLLGGLSPDRNQLLMQRVANIYAFVARTLATAHWQRDEQAVDDALRVLEIERETWRQVCEQLGGDRKARPTSAPHFAKSMLPTSRHSSSGISFEA